MSLTISQLKVGVEEKKILKGVDLEVNPGEIHAIMGPNGSGKSTLANSLAGHPTYQIEFGSVLLDDQPLLPLAPDERARLGLFLSFQYPVEIAGLRIHQFLKVAYDQRFHDQPTKKYPTLVDFRQHVNELASRLKITDKLLSRGLNENFSGGEKKRLEMLQLLLLEPKYALLDETDSGLDIDALKLVAEAITIAKNEYHTGFVIITHYQRILDHVKPDFVHVMKNGEIIKSGGADLASKLEKEGYKNLTK